MRLARYKFKRKTYQKLLIKYFRQTEPEENLPPVNAVDMALLDWDSSQFESRYPDYDFTIKSNVFYLHFGSFPTGTGKCYAFYAMRDPDHRYVLARAHSYVEMYTNLYKFKKEN